MAMPMTGQKAAAQREHKASEHTSEAQDTMTPKGTLLILFLYAGVLIALWSYTYAAMLMRR